MASVTVCGSATASVTPDRAELTLALSTLAPDPATALDQVAARSQQLAALLTAHHFTPEQWATEGLSVAEEYEWRDNSNVLVGHRAATAITVTIRDVDVVGAVIRDAVTGPAASVRNLAWKVDVDNPARRALLGAAARDARVRAQAYTEALGLQLGEVETISEAPLGDTPGPPREMMLMKAGRGAADSAEVAVSGGLVELSADVFVRFAMLPSLATRG